MAFKSSQNPDEQRSNAEVEAMIVEFEKKLDRLKTLYEQYFMGIEKREPTVPLKDVVRVMRALENEQIRNTGLRFRYRTLVQKLNTYRTYWNRTLREIERGTYHRDLARLRRSLARKGIEMPSVGKLRSVTDVERAMSEAGAAQQGKKREDDTDRFQVPAAANVRGASADDLRRRLGDGASEPAPEPALGPLDLNDDEDEEETGRHTSGFFNAPPPRRGAQAPAARQESDLPPAPRTPSSPGMQRAPSSPGVQRAPSTPGMRPAAARGRGPSEEEVQSLYRRFVRAKQLCGEDTSSVHIDSLKKSIEHQLPKIQKMYKGRDVEFQVVIRSGRAILKAKPK